MKLHLGCGERYLDGFTHIDIADFEHIDFKIPVNDLSIFEKNFSRTYIRIPCD